MAIVRNRKAKLMSMITMLMIIHILHNKRRKINRRFKVRPLNRRRNEVGHFNTFFRYIKEHDSEQFFRYTRMSVPKFKELLAIVEPALQKQPNRHPLTPEFQLVMTLHFLSEGCSMQQMAWDYFVGKSTVHYVTTNTCSVLWDLLCPIYIPVPNREGWEDISKEFYYRWNIPNCVGAIDGKHIEVQAPKHYGSEFFSYKKSHSIVLMAVCDSYYKFTMVDVGAPGSYHDSVIFKNSALGQGILNNTLDIPPPKELPGTQTVLHHFFIADAAFPLCTYIMRPYVGSHLGEYKNTFNNRLSRARRVIENSFGILSQRWRILRRPIIADVDNTVKFVKATLVLHNFIEKGEKDLPLFQRKYCPSGFADWVDESGNIHEGRWRQNISLIDNIKKQSSYNSTKHSLTARDALTEWFHTDRGAVSWQKEMVLAGSLPQ